MSRYMMPKMKHTKSRKYNGKCEGGGKPKALNEVFCYVDENNYAIGYHSPYLCRECYIAKYGKRGKENEQRETNRISSLFGI
jgi:hypothetical protein